MVEDEVMTTVEDEAVTILISNFIIMSSLFGKNVPTKSPKQNVNFNHCVVFFIPFVSTLKILRVEMGLCFVYLWVFY